MAANNSSVAGIVATATHLITFVGRKPSSTWLGRELVGVVVVFRAQQSSEGVLPCTTVAWLRSLEVSRGLDFDNDFTRHGWPLLPWVTSHLTSIDTGSLCAIATETLRCW